MIDGKRPARPDAQTEGARELLLIARIINDKGFEAYQARLNRQRDKALKELTVSGDMESVFRAQGKVMAYNEIQSLIEDAIAMAERHAASFGQR